MKENHRRNLSWQLGMTIGAVAFGLVYLPAALAGHKAKVCESGETKMCDKKHESICAKNSEVTDKQNHGYTVAIGGVCSGDDTSSN
jgi:hypothetical protein